MAKKKQVHLKRLLGAAPCRVDPYDADLEWMLLCSAAACGQKGQSVGIFISHATDPEHTLHDGLFGWGKRGDGRGAVGRVRELRRAWIATSQDQREVLCAKYLLQIGQLSQYPGMHGALGNLSGIVLLIAHRKGALEKLGRDVVEAQAAGPERRRKIWDTWRSRAAKADVEAHACWLLARADCEAA